MRGPPEKEKGSPAKKSPTPEQTRNDNIGGTVKSVGGRVR
jgi:hypothetical protein